MELFFQKTPKAKIYSNIPKEISSAFTRKTTEFISIKYAKTE